MSWKTDVRLRFSTEGAARRWSELYHGEVSTPEDHFFRQRCDRAATYLLERFDERASILDLGCGSGPVTTILRRHGRRAVALDCSLDMLRFANERMVHQGVAGGGLVQGDGERLPFPPSTFDAVVCLGVISYVEDFRGVLREARRVLKPDGRLVVSSRNGVRAFYDPVEPAKAAIRWVRHRRNGHRPPIGRPLSPHEVERRLGESGFAIETFTGIGFGPPRLNHRRLLSVGAAIRFSDSLGAVFARLGAPVAYRWLADVNLWTCRPSAPGAAPIAAPSQRDP